MPMTKEDLRERGEVLRHKLEAGRVETDISGEINQWFDEIKTVSGGDTALLQLWDRYTNPEATPGEKIKVMDEIIGKL